ncbi:MAG: hypothetical protein MZU91_11760 [Desulfosudis oleivorans]|nr:hypothetical protein [Desulfosudis oleivorans]
MSTEVRDDKDILCLFALPPESRTPSPKPPRRSPAEGSGRKAEPAERSAWNRPRIGPALNGRDPAVVGHLPGVVQILYQDGHECSIAENEYERKCQRIDRTSAQDPGHQDQERRLGRLHDTLKERSSDKRTAFA